MPVSVFENSFDEPITFILEPNGARYALPPLAKIGVRYSFEAGTVDRTFADIAERTIHFWCDSPQRDVEIVYPNAFDRLLRDICVRDGFCGRLVNEQPCSVTDLLPANGNVSAEEFAKLVIQAEGDDADLADKVEEWIARLQARFVEHMGHASVAAEALVQNLAQPFDSHCR